MTYNIHGDIGPFLGRNVVQELEQVILKYDADVVCLQEFWKSSLTNRKNLQKSLRKIWPYFHYGENSFFPTYNLGNAIFSRYEIIEHKNLMLGKTSNEQRGLLKTVVLLPNSITLTIFCTHLSIRYRESSNELAECIKHIKADNPDRFILAGDFNDWRGHFSSILSEKLGCREAGISFSGRHINTFPALFPLLPLDRIYYKGIELKSVARCTQRLAPSDHRSILAFFNLPHSATASNT